MTEAEVALRATDIHRTYGGVRALRGVDLVIRRGEVHTLAGVNGSGKSTLIKILNGVERPDGGTIEIDGEQCAHLTVPEAISHGVQVIYQDLSLFGNLSVAENIAMTTRVAARARFVSAGAARRTALAVLGRLQLDIDVDALVETLPVAQRQLIAICRALANDVRILFMDEPTTALTWHEVEKFFAVVESLRADGVAIVFVSHKTEEVLAISDRITVLRNGDVVATGRASEFDRDSLVEALIGRSAVEERVVSELEGAPEPVLRVEGLGAPGLFKDITFDVAPGEIIGLTGLMGSGRSEVADAVFGIIRTTEGSVSVAGRTLAPGSVTSAIDAGIGYVPPDRLTQGVFLDQPITRSVVAASISRLTSRLGRIRRHEVDALVTESVDDLQIKIGRASDPVRSLSGGNAQKVAIAKWLATDPRVLVLNGPTVGVDIGAKAAILDILRERAAAGTAVVVVSDDIPELVGVCHRVLVIRRGRLVEEIQGDAVTLDAVREAAVS